jgi:hypothetical protein
MRQNASMARTCSAMDRFAAFATAFGSFERRRSIRSASSLRQIAIDRIVCERLIGDDVRFHAAPHSSG